MHEGSTPINKYNIKEQCLMENHTRIFNVQIIIILNTRKINGIYNVTQQCFIYFISFHDNPMYIILKSLFNGRHKHRILLNSKSEVCTAKHFLLKSIYSVWHKSTINTYCFFPNRLCKAEVEKPST